MIRFTPEGIFDQKGFKFVVFQPNFDPPIFDNLKDKRNLDARNAGKNREVDISGAQG